MGRAVAFLPVSVKGIIFEAGGVWLRRNERQEWELPGGKLDEGEQPTETVAREMREELGLEVTVRQAVHAHRYAVDGSVDEHSGVLVLSYLCGDSIRVGDVEHQGEAGPAQFRLWPVDEVESATMPSFYKEAIRLAVNLQSETAGAAISGSPAASTDSSTSAA